MSGVAILVMIGSITFLGPSQPKHILKNHPCGENPQDFLAHVIMSMYETEDGKKRLVYNQCIDFDRDGKTEAEDYQWILEAPDEDDSEGALTYCTTACAAQDKELVDIYWKDWDRDYILKTLGLYWRPWQKKMVNCVCHFIKEE